MKNLLCLLLALTPAMASIAQTSGGPDAFGYYWRDSNDPNGPSFNWVDITTVGTQVTGLTDDNATPFITMDGMSFHYYWSDVTKIIVGSNGWLGLSAASNIAHCFPTIPSQGGAADHFLAPYMTDLLISQSGFEADVYYYHDEPNNQFIVSYIDCPWWNVNSPGYLGSNTFQVILSGQDSSITYQYLDVDQTNLTDQTACASDLVIGMENLTGNIGLQVYQEQVPQDNYAIKFYYPEEITFSIPDAGPNWNLNTENKGQFVLANTDFNLQTGISNFGNADISTEIEVTANVQDLNLTNVYSGADTIPNLASNALTTVVFSEQANLPEGQYYFQTQTFNGEDINPSNNTNISEVNAVDMTQGSFMLSYATQQLPDGSVLWQGGDGGVGVYLKPPSYPVFLDSITVYISDFGGAQNFRIEVYDDDNGVIPGTMLALENVSGSSYIPNSWVTVPLSSPIEITEGGIYIGWIHITGSTIAIGTETAGPISQQSFEYIGGNWAAYRENATQDILINGHFTTACGSFTVNTESINHVSCFGGTDGAIDVTVSGGTPPYSYNWDNAIGAVEDPNNIGAGVYVLSVSDDGGCSNGTTVTINQANAIEGSASVTGAAGGNSGAIDFTASGGTPPYSYSWSTGFSTEDLTGLTTGTYTVTVTDAAGCEEEFTYNVPDQVGIDDLQTVALEIFPNPNNGQFNITGDFRNGVFEVLDIAGRTIDFRATVTSSIATLDLENVPAGFYLIKWTDSERMGTARISVLE